MSLGGGGTTTRTEETRVTKLQISTSAYGVGKARVWGKQRVSGNMLWYGDFNAIPHTTTTSSGGGGGKGGGGSVTTENTSYTYTAGVMLALCSGTIAGVGAVWSDKAVTSLDALGLGLSTGVLRQAPWAHLTSNHPDQAVSYSGIAYVASAALALDSSASMPNLSFEVYGERIIPGGDDAYAQDVIYDVLCDAVDGLGMGDVLADTGDYALWCQAKGLTVALAATSQTAARDVIAQIAKATLSEPIRSNGKIKMVPYGDEPVGGWSPVTSPDYDLTESDLLEPPQHRRKQPSDATNRVTLNYSSRAKDYNTVAVTREDLSAVTQFGARPETIDLPCISNETQASIVCEFWRDRNLYIRNEWEIVVDERFCLIEAMDLLTITFGPQGLYREPVRVVEVTDDGSGKITLLVEEWPFGLLTATLIPTQPTSGYTPEYSVAPGDVNDPVILEAPNYLTAPNLEIWIGASGGEHWGGANVWVSDDNYSYQQVGAITNPARHGVLTSAFAEGNDPDTAHKLYVSLAVSRGQLLSGTQADADNGNTLCWVDGEMIAYQNADLVAEHKYALSYLRRGMYGTASAGHLAQSEFLRIDGAVFKYAVPRERIGSPVWIKLQSYNKYGRSVQPLDTVTAHQYTIAGNKPLPLASLSATGGLFSVKLDWTLTPGQVGVDYVELWCSASSSLANAWQLTIQNYPVLTWTHMGLSPGDSHYYWGRVIDTSGNASDFYPLAAGIVGTPITDPTDLLTQLEGALGMPQLAAELAEPIGRLPDINLSDLNLAIDSLFQSVASDTASGETLKAASAIKAETINRDTAIQAETAKREIMAAKISSDIVSAIQTEQTVRASAISAEATAREQLEAQVSGNTAAIQTEQTARATQDSALSSRIDTVQASLGNSIATVQQKSEASASAINGLYAKWSVKTQVMQDGQYAVAGVELLSGVPGQSVFAVLADRFLVYQPNGIGAPKQVLTMGTVNGVTALGFDGSAIFDGSITARQINGTGLKITGEVNVGGYTGYFWPPAGQTGAHLSAQGFLAGNANGGGKYFQIYTPAGDWANARINTNIPAYLGELTVDTIHIKNNAITTTTHVQGADFMGATGDWRTVASAYADVGSAGAVSVQCSCFVEPGSMQVGSDNVVSVPVPAYLRILSPSGVVIAIQPSYAGACLIGKGTQTGTYSFQIFADAGYVKGINMVLFTGKK